MSEPWDGPNLDNVSDGSPWWTDGDRDEGQQFQQEYEQWLDQQDDIERAKSENEH